MSEPVILSAAEIDALKIAIKQSGHPWERLNERGKLILKAARAHLDLMRQEPTNQSNLHDEYGLSNPAEDDGARIGRAKDAL